jgi:hypothetical protein
MVKVLLLTCFCWLFYDSGQFKAEKVWLFSKKQYTGNVPVRVPGGQPKGPLTIVLCFMELKKGDPVPTWNKGNFNGSKFNVTTQEVTETMNQDSVIAGTLKDYKTPAIIKPDTGYQLIRLSLLSEGADGNANDEVFTLTGKIGKRELVLKSKEPVVELAPDRMP